MTALNVKPLVRETRVLYRKRPIVLELHQHFVVLRVKGTKQHTTLAYDTLYEFGLKRDYLKGRL